jgi:putative solute:sodium symporter small subunit
MKKEQMKAYWRKNIQYVLILLSIWFISSYGLGILLVEELNQIRMGGFKLGFWFAQQGAIYVFVLLIFVYVYLMNKLDREFDVDEKEELTTGDKLADEYTYQKENVKTND